MVQAKNHYRTLGVSENASMDEIKKAYKNLAKRWHPDKNPARKEFSEKKFKEISEAYRTLSDGAKRSDYDLENEQRRYQDEMDRKSKHDEKIRRMAREQEEYVRKQNARRARAHGHSQSAREDFFTDFATGTHESAFNNFFADREEWRRRVPNLFAHESAFSNIMREMDEIMKTAFGMAEDTSKTHQGTKKQRSQTGRRRHVFHMLQPQSRSIDDVFNDFFSNTGGMYMAGFSH